MGDDPTSDYAFGYADTYQSPQPAFGGIYTLEEGKYGHQKRGKGGYTRTQQEYNDNEHTAGYDARNEHDEQNDEDDVYSPSQHRGKSRGGCDSGKCRRELNYRREPGSFAASQREGFSSAAYARGDLNTEPGSSTGLRSARYNQPALNSVMWNPSPPILNASAPNIVSEIMIPQVLRPAGGGPSFNLTDVQRPQSQAIAMIDRFAGTPASPATAPLSTERLMNILFFVIIVLLAMWIANGMIQRHIATSIQTSMQEFMQSQQVTPSVSK